MAVLQGFIASSGFGGALHKYLSKDFDIFDQTEIIGWPAYNSIGELGYTGTPKNNFPVKVSPRKVTGLLCNSYLQDFYYRIHIIPLRIDLGNVSSNQGFQIIVWNAYFTPKTVNSLSGIESGMQVIPPAPMPYKIAPLLESSWAVEVSSEGDPQIDTQISWNFADANAPKVHITGMRVTMWPFVPDWSEPIEERLEWATDVLASSTGAEQRRALRISPRRYYKAQFVFFKSDRQHFDMCMTHNAAGTWALPLWAEMQQLDAALAIGATEIKCITANREFRPGTMVVLRGAEVGDIFTIETGIVGAVLADRITLQRPLQQAWPAGARLYPARSARFSSLPKVVYESDEAITTELAFESIEPNDWLGIPPTKQYRGFPVFDQKPDENKNLTSEYLRLLQTLDTVAGIPSVTDTAGVGFSIQEHAWFLLGAEELNNFKKLLYSLRGKQVPVWVPSFRADMTLARESANDVIYIERMGFTHYGFKKVGKRDIYIESGNGSTSIHRVIESTEVGAIERLVIEPLLPLPLTPGMGRISFLALCRLDSDSVTLEHVGDVTSLTRAKVIWRSLRDELEKPQVV